MLDDFSILIDEDDFAIDYNYNYTVNLLYKV